MAENRVPRSVETRENDKRKTSWVPPASFPKLPNSESTVYRWIRTHVAGEYDARSYQRRYSEGWRPVAPSDLPDIALAVPPQSDINMTEIRVGSVVLCANSAEKMRDRKLYYQNKTDQQMKSVDHSMFKLQDRRLPMFREHSSRVSLGRKPSEVEKRGG